MTFWMRWLEAFPKSQPEFDDPQFDLFFTPFPRPLGDGVPLADTETAPPDLSQAGRKNLPPPSTHPT